MKNINDEEFTGKSLKDSVLESLQVIEEGIKGVNPADEKLFWKWVKDLGEIGTKDDISDVISDDEENFYKKVSDLGTTEEQFETFCDVFFTIANHFMSFIEDDEDQEFGSDDSCEYASWAAPFYGEKRVTKALKDKDTTLCHSWGEEIGYAMTPDDYSDYIEDNKLKPAGYK